MSSLSLVVTHLAEMFETQKGDAWSPPSLRTRLSVNVFTALGISLPSTTFVHCLTYEEGRLPVSSEKGDINSALAPGLYWKLESGYAGLGHSPPPPVSKAP